MKKLTTIEELRRARASLPGTVGLVPTMGFLHDGHLSLVRRAREECQSVIVTIFVNPTQFGENEDLADYPRDLQGDLAKLEREGVDRVWAPTAEIMYPEGYQTWVHVGEITGRLEGRMRPGHFQGVTTVVAKLFNSTQPHRAYFGQKDAQQLVVIQRMTTDLNMPIEIVVCPTVREADGLAMSSRNSYLNADQRRAAPVLHRALQAAQTAYDQGERHAARLLVEMQRVLDAEPRARVQYVSCADPTTLKELDVIDDEMLLSMAVYVGQTRLIDNFRLDRGVWMTGVQRENRN